MVDTPGIKMKNPSHPGRFVKLIVLEPLALSVSAAARALGVTRPTLSLFLNGRTSLSPEMAIRLEKAFDLDMETLMRMQNAYDVARARKHAAKIRVKRYIATDAPVRA
jgi:antitoxin HigA-1